MPSNDHDASITTEPAHIPPERHNGHTPRAYESRSHKKVSRITMRRSTYGAPRDARHRHHTTSTCTRTETVTFRTRHHASPTVPTSEDTSKPQSHAPSLMSGASRGVASHGLACTRRSPHHSIHDACLVSLSVPLPGRLPVCT